VTRLGIDDLTVAVFVSAGKAFDGFAKENANAHETPAPNTYLRIAVLMISSSLPVAATATKVSSATKEQKEHNDNQK
jgi:hypothetical protein